MLITKNGQIDGRPETSMVRRNGIWYRLLVCRVADSYTDAELLALFRSDTVRDDAIGMTWHYTAPDTIRRADGYAYVWLTYTAETADAAAEMADMQAALNELGVTVDG
jgi:hypothetical protein